MLAHLFFLIQFVIFFDYFLPVSYMFFILPISLGDRISLLGRSLECTSSYL